MPSAINLKRYKSYVLSELLNAQVGQTVVLTLAIQQVALQPVVQCSSGPCKNVQSRVKAMSQYSFRG